MVKLNTRNNVAYIKKCFTLLQILFDDIYYVNVSIIGINLQRLHGDCFCVDFITYAWI